MEVAELQTFMGGGGSTHSFNLSTKNSASLSALMTIEADTGLRHVTRLMKIITRAS